MKNKDQDVGVVLEETLQQNIAELDHIYKSAPVGLCLMDRELRYLRVNERLAAFHGIPVADHIGRTLHDVIPEIAPKVVSVFDRVCETGEPILDQEVQGSTSAEPGVLRHWLASYYPLKGEDGSVKAFSIVVQEITQTKVAQKALQKSEARLRELLETSLAIPWEADPETWLVSYIGPKAVSVFGYPIERWLEKDFWIQHIHAEDRDRVIEFFGAQAASSDDCEHEYRMVHADGSTVWVQDIAHIERSNGVPTMLRGFLIDITERKEAEFALKESEERLARQAAILGQVHDAVISTDLSGSIQTWNKAAERIYGYSAEEALGRNVAFLHSPEEEPMRDQRVIGPLLEKGSHEVVLRNRKKSGEEILINLRLSLLRDKQGNPIGIIGCSNDITERTRLQEGLLKIASQEQRRIGQELHDTAGQELVGLGYLSKSLVQNLEKRESSHAEMARKIGQGLDRTLGQVRALSRGLIPSEIRKEHFVSAMTELVSRVGEMGMVNCKLDCGKEVALHSDSKATQIYRIAQESITNAIKHGDAKNILITIDKREELLRVTVQDDGNGMASNQSNEGLGLKIMAYRAEMIGATLEFEANKAGGTSVICTLSGVD